MEVTNSNPPKKITDEFEAVCSHCNKVIYGEKIVGHLQDDGSYKYTKLTYGSFLQDCDETGVPSGPVIPKCFCK